MSKPTPKDLSLAVIVIAMAILFALDVPANTELPEEIVSAVGVILTYLFGSISWLSGEE
jgi:hypothetical protein